MKNFNGIHIGFCGIDGAGKSTQALLLCKWLKDQGANAIVYEEKRNFVSEVTDTIARQKGLPSGRAYFGENLYMICISFEVLRQNMLNIRSYTSASQTIISSRTVFDWIAGAMTRGCENKELDLIKEIILFRGTPDLTIWLDTKPSVALKRVEERRFDQGNFDYLTRYQNSFEMLLKNYSHERVSGGGKIETVHKEIIRTVKKFLL